MTAVGEVASEVAAATAVVVAAVAAVDPMPALISSREGATVDPHASLSMREVAVAVVIAMEEGATVAVIATEEAVAVTVTEEVEVEIATVTAVVAMVATAEAADMAIVTEQQRAEGRELTSVHCLSWMHCVLPRFSPAVSLDNVYQPLSLYDC